MKVIIMGEEQAICRIAVIGAGAIGSALGALLHRASRNVVFIARPTHVTAIRQDGLLMDGVMGSYTTPVEAAETLHFRPDLALLTVKAQDVGAAVKANLVFLSDAWRIQKEDSMISKPIYAHCHLFSAKYVVEEAAAMGWAYVTGNYPHAEVATKAAPAGPRRTLKRGGQ
jgi:glycerol-3-phosphate dehydrogenase